MTEIKTWHERAMEHPDHQNGMVSEVMLRARMCEEIGELRAEIERLRARDAKLREALEFYALPQSWKSTILHMCGHRGDSRATLDRGAKARAALEAKP